ncbi:MAG TPA: sigma-54-dependent Fis family transcriptional regulator [Thermoguttaceae bacterium]|nr:sigma-54-dependent Fis family transcriptional regulator [Thermoguttaceae bacterium]
MRTPSSPDPGAFEGLRDNPHLATVVSELFWRANHVESTASYLSDALAAVSSAAGGDFVALATARGGQWVAVAQSGSRRSLPVDLLGEVLDQEASHLQDPWVAVPLAAQAAAAEALVLHCAEGTKAVDALATLAKLGPILADGLAAVDRCHRDRRRIRRLERILEIANQWNRTREVVPLLVQMAEAATQLLGADRASIFLWDRRNHTLVGRPALGVDEGELRIPDDRGVVGQVIRTGEPLRVDAATEPERIDHQVDSQLGYETRTLLCVPMRGRSGEMFGAFELINSVSDEFTKEDEAALVELAGHAAVALENAQDRENLLSTSRQITEQAAERVQLIGESPAIEALRSIIRRVAHTDLAVLILGENGTGKEVVAQSIHYLSGRREKPFVAVNCAAIPDTLAESELFGHEKGAFTDARETRQGKFELAADGTLFLDEIGDLSLSCQAKLLRVLEERVLVRVGGSESVHTDARVVAATNQDLAEMVRQKQFREDLYFRLNVVTLELPPLRERTGDILLLAGHFLEDFSKKARRRVPEISADARRGLETHPWPGNVRELRNLMERLAYLSTEDRIEVEDLAFILSPRGSSPLFTTFDQALAQATQQFQVAYIKQAIERAGGNMTEAASQLGLHRSNLYRKMRQLDVPVPS